MALLRELPPPLLLLFPLLAELFELLFAELAKELAMVLEVLETADETTDAGHLAATIDCICPMVLSECNDDDGGGGE